MATKRNVNSALDRMQERTALRKAQIDRKLALLIRIKLAVLIAVPVAYFLFSPLLLLVVGAYGALWYVTVRIERDINSDAPTGKQIRIPRLDSIFAVIIVGFVTLTVLFSLCATVSTPSIYAGQTDQQLDTMLRAEDSTLLPAQRADIIDQIHESGATMPLAARYALQQLTMFTGMRVGFVPFFADVLGGWSGKVALDRTADTGVYDYSLVESWSGWLDFSFVLINVMLMTMVIIGVFWLYRTKYSTETRPAKKSAKRNRR